MYVCMYMCIYECVYMYICIYVYMYICIYVICYMLYMYIYICMCVCACVCIYVYVYVYMYICIYVYIYINSLSRRRCTRKEGGHIHTHILSLARAPSLPHRQSFKRSMRNGGRGDTYVLVASSKSKRQLHTLFRFSECYGGIGSTSAKQHSFSER
jgi:hypothetical protein